MATTDFGALDVARVRFWAAKALVGGRDASFYRSNGFVGENSQDQTKPIQRITELTKTSKGTEAVMQLIADLRQDGVVGNNQLTGQEEPMVNDAQVLKIDLLRHGVKSEGKMAEQATVNSFREQGRGKLGYWINDRIDELFFLTIAGRAYTLTYNGATRAASQFPSLTFAADVAAPTTNRILYAGSATSTATLTAADKMSWELLTRIKSFAQRKRLQPIRSKGKPYYCVVMSSEQERDLQQDGTYQTITRSAASRGDDNPLFTGATAMVQGLALFSHNKTANTLDGTSGTQKWGAASTIDGAQAQVLGANALGWCTIEEPQWAEADITDYGNQPGIALGQRFGILKPQYKYGNQQETTREDFGTLSVYTAAAA